MLRKKQFNMNLNCNRKKRAEQYIKFHTKTDGDAGRDGKRSDMNDLKVRLLRNKKH